MSAGDDVGFSLVDQAIAHHNLPGHITSFLKQLDSVESTVLLVVAQRILSEVGRRSRINPRERENVGCLVLADGNAKPDLDVVSHSEHKVELSTIDQFLRERSRSAEIVDEEWIVHIAKLGG